MYPQDLLERPFGAESRRFLIRQYLDSVGVVTPEDAWKHVYRLLMWIDPTTSLAHCYESDKSQPGRHWYDRSMAFHAWLSAALGSSPRTLHREIDILFKGVISILAVVEAEEKDKRRKNALRQRADFDADMPDATGDPDLIENISAMLAQHYGTAPSEALVSEIIDTVTQDLYRENKRKNLLGEGFEDTLASVIRECAGASSLEVHNRALLHDLPGFREPPKHEKARAVDLAVVSKTTGHRSLATVKWSVRADREEQFTIDLDTYSRMEFDGQPFSFVFLTNEFDAARLVAACRRRHGHRLMFDAVVHMNPEALVAVHSLKTRAKANDLLEHINEGRLISLGQWIRNLEAS